MKKAPRFAALLSLLAKDFAKSVRRAGTAVAHGLEWAREMKQLANSERASSRGLEQDSVVPMSAQVPPRDRTRAARRHPEIVDREAVEVPVGSTSDSSYQDQLSHGRLSQPSTTGAALFGLDERVDGTLEGMLRPSEREITAQPSERPRMNDGESYDAMAPENTGLEWLNRATEAPVAALDGDPLENMIIEGELGASLTGEGSLEASMPHEMRDEDDEADEDDFGSRESRRERAEARASAQNEKRP
jgi:hypothetical protein